MKEEDTSGSGFAASNSSSTNNNSSSSSSSNSGSKSSPAGLSTPPEKNIATSASHHTDDIDIEEQQNDNEIKENNDTESKLKSSASSSESIQPAGNGSSFTKVGTPAVSPESFSVPIGGSGGSRNTIQRTGTNSSSNQSLSTNGKKISHRGSVDGTVDTSAQERARLNRELRGVPVRCVYKSLKSMQRHRDFVSLFFHLVFLGLYVWIVIGVMQVSVTYNQITGITDIIVDEEIPNDDGSGPFFKKNFLDIFSFEEYFQWVRGPLLNAIYADTHYNDQPYDDSSRLVLPGGLSGNRVIGPIRFRTVRVQVNKTSHCKQFSEAASSPYWRSDNHVADCYPIFSKSSLSKDPWVHDYKDGLSKVRGIDGYGRDFGIGYGEEAYIYDLPTVRINSTTNQTEYVTKEEADALVKSELMDKFWADKQTRVLVVDFNLISFNLGNGLTVRLVVEVMAGGGFFVYHRMYPIVLNPLGSAYDAFRLVGQILFCIWSSFLCLRQFVFLSSHPWAVLHVFSSFWSLVEFLNNVLSVVVVCLIIYAEYGFFGSEFTKKLLVPEDPTEFFDIFEQARFLSYVSYFACFNIAFACLKIFNYLRHVSRMTIMWDALRQALPEIFALAMAFLILNTAFVLIGHLLFGFWVQSFHSLSISYSTLFRSVVGDFNYREIQTAEPNLAGVYYAFVLFFQFFTLLNMFIAVVTETYAVAKNEVQDNRYNDKTYPTIALSPNRRRFDSFKLKVARWYFSQHSAGGKRKKLWFLSCCKCTKKQKPEATVQGSRDANMGNVTLRFMSTMFGGDFKNEDNPSLQVTLIERFRKCPSNWMVDDISPEILRLERAKWLSSSAIVKYKTSPYRKIWWYIVHLVCVKNKLAKARKRRSVGSDEDFVQEVERTRRHLISVYGSETCFTRNWNIIKGAGKYKTILSNLQVMHKTNRARVKIYQILTQAVKRQRVKFKEDLFKMFFSTWRRMKPSERNKVLNFEDMLKILGYTEGDEECFAQAKQFLKLSQTIIGGPVGILGSGHNHLYNPLDPSSPNFDGDNEDGVVAEQRRSIRRLENKLDYVSQRILDIGRENSIRNVKTWENLENKYKKMMPNVSSENRLALLSGRYDLHDVTHIPIDVTFYDGPLGFQLGKVGLHFIISKFMEGKNGELLQAEGSGLLQVGDKLVAVEEENLEGLTMKALIERIKKYERPFTMHFVRPNNKNNEDDTIDIQKKQTF